MTCACASQDTSLANIGPLTVDPARCVVPAGLLPGSVVLIRRAEVRQNRNGTGLYIATLATTHVSVERIAPIGWDVEQLENAVLPPLLGLDGSGGWTSLGDLDPWLESISFVVVRVSVVTFFGAFSSLCCTPL